ncbi:fructose-bisphosphatase class III [Sorangium sp. So ce1036]|uniref:fructose-bisphosphatase class III n=1 Tax=Sorangium sp. So ce1036 TaxID=3133328 RepID=UPI003F0F86EA
MLDTRELPLLRALAGRYPTTEAALAEIGHLRAILSLPKGTVHVVSDVHGEHRKLKHIINNASGSLRPLVERVFGDRLTADEKRALLSVIYYPRESYARVARGDAAARRAFVLWALAREIEVIRELSLRYTLRQVEQAFPADMRGLLRELVSARAALGEGAYVDALVDPFLQHGREIEILRATARAIRNLTVFELVVAGDLGDRGPRLDKVIEYLMRQPRARVVWGNHDVSWMGASLGQEALIATVVRLSLRYGRLAQLEEGFGIPVAPVDRLARTAYADDPAARFAVRGEGLRDALLMARMQKAMAILQLKLEGQLCRRRPEYALEHRCLLHRVDPRAGTVTIDGERHELLDTRFPTLGAGDPYALTQDEAACIALLKESFLKSPVLSRQMRWMVQQGTTWLRRDRALIFHGCVPVDGEGAFLPFEVDGAERRGRALFDALERKVRRAFRGGAQDDVDMLWYLWTGPLSPMFGKDRMTTFESYFVADEATHRETKNPYFHLIHDAGFCGRVCREFGVDEERGLIVNGHVPVRVERGESPIKASRRAVTIDGAFSEAYGDKGYTLVLEASGARLAQHHHFTSVEQAVEAGEDIIPAISDVEVHGVPRRVADTEKGEELAREIEVLERLIQAYEDGALTEPPR